MTLAGEKLYEARCEIGRLERDLADCKSRHETSLEVIRAREQEVERQRVEIEQCRELICRLRTIIGAKLHLRRCHDCGTEFYAADGITPYCLCDRCGSQDTRRVKAATASP